jgi:hypothetical protein
VIDNGFFLLYNGTGLSPVFVTEDPIELADWLIKNETGGNA